MYIGIFLSFDISDGFVTKHKTYSEELNRKFEFINVHVTAFRMALDSVYSQLAFSLLYNWLAKDVKKGSL